MKRRPAKGRGTEADGNWWGRGAEADEAYYNSGVGQAFWGTNRPMQRIGVNQTTPVTELCQPSQLPQYPPLEGEEIAWPTTAATSHSSHQPAPPPPHCHAAPTAPRYSSYSASSMARYLPTNSAGVMPATSHSCQQPVPPPPPNHHATSTASRTPSDFSSSSSAAAKYLSTNSAGVLSGFDPWQATGANHDNPHGSMPPPAVVDAELQALLQRTGLGMYQRALEEQEILDVDNLRLCVEDGTVAFVIPNTAHQQRLKEALRMTEELADTGRQRLGSLVGGFGPQPGSVRCSSPWRAMGPQPRPVRAISPATAHPSGENGSGEGTEIPLGALRRLLSNADCGGTIGPRGLR
eukprot:GGOE01021171.1.p1 GENE.GGOE01021171.1~~GGOE01021171.1.p1  ORF type:complete len:350 (-),score=26.22 GGOE01021171.1:238-1287(-)